MIEGGHILAQNLFELRLARRDPLLEDRVGFLFLVRRRKVVARKAVCQVGQLANELSRPPRSLLAVSGQLALHELLFHAEEFLIKRVAGRLHSRPIGIAFEQ